MHLTLKKKPQMSWPNKGYRGPNAVGFLENGLTHHVINCGFTIIMTWLRPATVIRDAVKHLPTWYFQFYNGSIHLLILAWRWAQKKWWVEPEKVESERVRVLRSRTRSTPPLRGLPKCDTWVKQFWQLQMKVFYIYFHKKLFFWRFIGHFWSYDALLL